jgi:hypothetical protein
VSGVVKHRITSFVLSCPDDRIGFDGDVKPPDIDKFSDVYLLKCWMKESFAFMSDGNDELVLT